MHFSSTLLPSLLLFLTPVLARRNATQLLRSRSRPTPNLKRTTGEVVTGAAAVSSVNDSDGPTSVNPPWNCYTGDGTDWPSKDSWVSFDSMWSGLISAGLGSSCSGGANSQQETDDIRTAIENVAAQSQVDHRFILAIIMNESSGCVRVKTTPGGSGIDNPGLMQDHDGYYTCNCNGIDEYGQGCGFVNPCPQATISGMITEGTMGTNAGSGLADLINQAQGSGASGAHTFYMAAELYNAGAGSVTASGDLSQYSKKVANWVTGWQGASSYSC